MKVYDEKALENLTTLLQEKPCTVRELATSFRRSPRSIRRWLVELGKRGSRVVRDGVKTGSPFMIVR